MCHRPVGGARRPILHPRVEERSSTRRPMKAGRLAPSVLAMLTNSLDAAVAQRRAASAHGRPRLRPTCGHLDSGACTSDYGDHEASAGSTSRCAAARSSRSSVPTARARRPPSRSSRASARPATAGRGARRRSLARAGGLARADRDRAAGVRGGARPHRARVPAPCTPATTPRRATSMRRSRSSG